jgi:carboxyl-terminal processing protease
LDELYKEVKQDKTLTPIQADLDALKNKVMHHKKEDLIKYKPEIKQYLEEEIVSRYYFQKGRVEASFREDPEIKEAITILNDSLRYQKILTTIVKPEKPFKQLGK